MFNNHLVYPRPMLSRKDKHRGASMIFIVLGLLAILVVLNDAHINGVSNFKLHMAGLLSGSAALVMAFVIEDMYRDKQQKRLTDKNYR